MTDLIPENLLQQLPLSDQPLARWTSRTDLLKFLVKLYSFPGTVMFPDGSEETSNTSFYGHYLYTNGKKRGRQWVREFERFARASHPAPAVTVEIPPAPDFRDDSSLGAALKHFIVWNALVGHVLEESASFSISHTHESEADLEASFYLAARLYYKQALQVLRTFLENLVLSVYFGHHPASFAKWKRHEYRVPSLRGPGGLLADLVGAHVLRSDLSNEIGRTYETLNRPVHGSERYLIHRGSERNEYRGHIFKYDDFVDWCEHVSLCVTIGAHLLAINSKQWDTIQAPHKVVCAICHNWDDFDIEPWIFGGKWSFTYRCRDCGHQQIYAQEYVGLEPPK